MRDKDVKKLLENSCTNIISLKIDTWFTVELMKTDWSAHGVS